MLYFILDNIKLCTFIISGTLDVGILNLHMIKELSFKRCHVEGNHPDVLVEFVSMNVNHFMSVMFAC